LKEEGPALGPDDPVKDRGLVILAGRYDRTEPSGLPGPRYLFADPADRAPAVKADQSRKVATGEVFRREFFRIGIVYAERKDPSTGIDKESISGHIRANCGTQEANHMPWPPYSAQSADSMLTAPAFF
jgi:hypothetical protein